MRSIGLLAWLVMMPVWAGEMPEKAADYHAALLKDLQARFEERACREPASPGPLVALAELAKARGDSRAELDLLRRATVNAPRGTAVISTLAALEERSGESDRALERYQTLARLAPGPDSGRQLAQAKIRLGDSEDGMRDLQAMAGEKGIALNSENRHGALASAGEIRVFHRGF